MRWHLALSLFGLCLPAADVGKAQTAQPVYPPPHVVDSKGKIVGHYTGNLVDLRIPGGPLVEASFTVLYGLDAVPHVTTEPNFYYPNRNCSGTRYMPAGTLLQRAVLDKRKRELVYPNGKTITLTAHSTLYINSSGQPDCGQADVAMSAVPAAAYSIDALGFSPPFKVTLK